MTNKEIAARNKKLIEEDRKKDVFETITEICKSDKDKLNDIEWVKEQLMKSSGYPPRPNKLWKI